MRPAHRGQLALEVQLEPLAPLVQLALWVLGLESILELAHRQCHIQVELEICIMIGLVEIYLLIQE